MYMKAWGVTIFFLKGPTRGASFPRCLTHRFFTKLDKTCMQTIPWYLTTRQCKLFGLIEATKAVASSQSGQPDQPFSCRKLTVHHCYFELGVIIFGSVWFLSKKVTKPKKKILKKKPNPNRNRVKSTGFGSVFLGQKPVQTGLARFFWFWLGFSGFSSVFSGLAWFFRFGSVLAQFFFQFFVGFGSVRFFRFFVYKTETEPNWPVFSKI